MIAPRVPSAAPRISRYEEMAYGLFLHWGLYSLIETGEWVMNYQKIPREKYAELAARFTANKFDARAMAAWAKKAGFRYVCLTTRHHDGFSLYDTRGLNAFDAPHSAAGRDLVKEFSDACDEAGLGKFFYHTTLDWRVDSFENDWSGYLKYLNDSVEILCTNYGRVDGLWFDGNWARKDRDWREDDLYAMIRKHQPECIIINNSSTKARGKVGHPEVDVVTFEQGAPTGFDRSGRTKYVALEMCDTINSHWGMARHDLSQKNPAAVIESLAACRRAGANLLLNIGPEASGALPAYEKAALDLAGSWIEKCAPSIYRGRPVDVICRGRDFVLSDGASHFYFAHDLPISGNMHLGASNQGLKTIQGELPQIKSVKWVDNGEPLDFTHETQKQAFVFNATPHPYGHQYVVRVAELS